jgi:hypothetical protein
MYKILLSLILISTLTFAATEGLSKMQCTLSQEGPVTVNWKAYKTPLKISVGGTFDEITYNPVKKAGKNFNEILVGTTVTINEASVNSKNKGRDAKLIKFFFEMMSEKEIKAKVVSIKAQPRERGKPKRGTLVAEITMNNVTKSIPMHYSFDQGTLTAEGTIDIFDFQATTALQALNKACFEKHQGKTWNDVAISFSTHIKAICEPEK